MANKKDLQEAQNYSRARLITAFTSGMPDGKELTPRKGLMPVAVSIGLTAVMVLISVFYGIISPGLPSDWGNNKLIVGKDTASRFVSVDGVLHPVINTTSARLLIPASEYRVITVDDKELEGIPVGSSVGIVGAPDILPNRSRLASRHMVSCLADDQGATASVVTDDPSAWRKAGDAQATLVNVDGTGYLIIDGTRHRLPKDPSTRDAVLRILGVGQLALDRAPKASVQWLDLFAGGSDLGTMSIPGAGDDIEVDGRTYVVGTLIADPSNDSTMYVVLKDGTLAPLSGLALDMYQLNDEGAQPPVTMTPQEQQQAGFRNASASVVPDDWPTRKLTALSAPRGGMCVALDTAVENGEAGKDDPSAGIHLVTFADPATAPKPSDSGVSVQNASGALLRAVPTPGATSGTLYVVDGTGVAYPVPDDDTETLKRLGFQTGDVTEIPRAWINVFRTGVSLSSKDASLQISAQNDAVRNDDEQTGDKQTGAEQTGGDARHGNGSGRSTAPGGEGEGSDAARDSGDGGSAGD
ncbi:type VII secretion protein EccB [Bifidobacterium leontopitheci]|uniref:Type VII secretion protein EccB n=1 Tax=Bifidobacterium leontopitheci TaxID=2650774 RepID=A0A6I1GDV9_9BIFI|nr:type VII secretion protein EccB [Bifidobacterium leontopitheci]KAB7789715.1 type VII secretion protein EccB [Bifidobacterium leontopitheci]